MKRYLLAGIAWMLSGMASADTPVVVSWTAPTACHDGTPLANCPITSYILTQTLPGGKPIALPPLAATVLSLTVNNLPIGNTCWWVQATSVNGPSIASATACYSMTDPAQPKGRPAAPTALKATKTPATP